MIYHSFCLSWNTFISPFLKDSIYILQYIHIYIYFSILSISSYSLLASSSFKENSDINVIVLALSRVNWFSVAPLKIFFFVLGFILYLGVDLFVFRLLWCHFLQQIWAVVRHYPPFFSSPLLSPLLGGLPMHLCWCASCCPTDLEVLFIFLSSFFLSVLRIIYFLLIYIHVH